MSTSYGGTPPGIIGTHYGGAGLGCRGDQVPSAGGDGAGYLYAGLALPADAAKEVRGPITRWPSGALVVYEDSAFDYTGPTDYALYQLYVDGVVSTTDIGYGAGIGRIDLNVGDGLAGGVQLGDVTAGGQLTGGTASQLGGSVQLDAVQAAGSIAGQGASGLGGDVLLDPVLAAGSLGTQGISELGGDVQLDPVTPGGLIIGVQPCSAPPAHRRLQTSTRGPRGGRRGAR